MVLLGISNKVDINLIWSLTFDRDTIYYYKL